MQRLFWIVQTCLGITAVLNEEREELREGARMMEAGCCALRTRPSFTAMEQEHPPEAGKSRTEIVLSKPR